jgi:sulfoxide reductase heme-binding subunit YedZ
MSELSGDHKGFLPSIKTVLWILGASLVLMVLVVIALVMASPARLTIADLFNALFALGSVQAMWYVTRAAGLTAYILLWLSTAWGLAISSKIFDIVLHRSFTYDFHQFISLLAVGFILLHIIVLMADRYLPFSVAQILIPFIDPYRPLWVGMGVIAFYLVMLVTVTFYLRSRIGMKTFRAIHVLSLVGYLGGLVHGFFSGTDSSLAATQWMYAISFLTVIFLTSFWLLVGRKRKALPASHPQTQTPARPAARPTQRVRL